MTPEQFKDLLSTLRSGKWVDFDKLEMPIWMSAVCRVTWKQRKK